MRGSHLNKTVDHFPPVGEMSLKKEIHNLSQLLIC